MTISKEDLLAGKWWAAFETAEEAEAFVKAVIKLGINWEYSAKWEKKQIFRQSSSCLYFTNDLGFSQNMEWRYPRITLADLPVAKKVMVPDLWVGINGVGNVILSTTDQQHINVIKKSASVIAYIPSHEAEVVE